VVNANFATLPPVQGGRRGHAIEGNHDALGIDPSTGKHSRAASSSIRTEVKIAQEGEYASSNKLTARYFCLPENPLVDLLQCIHLLPEIE
jgi:hypothetical protein